MPPFKTTSELLAYARENPHTLRSRWWEYYLVTDLGSVFRMHKLDLLYIEKEDCEMVAPHEHLPDKTWKPIPCPHFIFRYTTNWLPLLDGLKLPPKEYLAACNMAAAQPKHSHILCVQDAWRQDSSIFNDQLGEWLANDIWESLYGSGREVGVAVDLLEVYCTMLIDNLFTPAIAHQKEAFLKEHRERGLLNKKLFNT